MILRHSGGYGLRFCLEIYFICSEAEMRSIGYSDIRLSLKQVSRDSRAWNELLGAQGCLRLEPVLREVRWGFYASLGEYMLQTAFRTIDGWRMRP